MSSSGGCTRTTTKKSSQTDEVSQGGHSSGLMRGGTTTSRPSLRSAVAKGAEDKEGSDAEKHAMNQIWHELTAEALDSFTKQHSKGLAAILHALLARAAPVSARAALKRQLLSQLEWHQLELPLT